MTDDTRRMVEKAMRAVAIKWGNALHVILFDDAVKVTGGLVEKERAETDGWRVAHNAVINYKRRYTQRAEAREELGKHAIGECRECGGLPPGECAGAADCCSCPCCCAPPPAGPVLTASIEDALWDLLVSVSRGLPFERESARAKATLDATLLSRLRRTIAAAIKRGRAAEQDRLRVNKVHPLPNDVQDLLLTTADQLRAEADALEKED